MKKVKSNIERSVELFLYWKSSRDGEFPINAVKVDAYCVVVRIRHGKQYIPGKLYIGMSYAISIYNKKEIVSTKYQVLVDTSGVLVGGYKWENCTSCGVPFGAIVGGSDKGNYLFIAKTNINGETVLGTYLPENRCSYFKYKEKECKLGTFDVLCGTIKLIKKSH